MSIHPSADAAAAALAAGVTITEAVTPEQRTKVATMLRDRAAHADERPREVVARGDEARAVVDEDLQPAAVELARHAPHDARRRRDHDRPDRNREVSAIVTVIREAGAEKVAHARDAHAPGVARRGLRVVVEVVDRHEATVRGLAPPQQRDLRGEERRVAHE